MPREALLDLLKRMTLAEKGGAIGSGIHLHLRWRYIRTSRPCVGLFLNARSAEILRKLDL